MSSSDTESNANDSESNSNQYEIGIGIDERREDKGQGQGPLSNYLGMCTSTNLSESAGTGADSASPKSWRTRDPIYALRHRRQQLERRFLPLHDQTFTVDKSAPKGHVFGIEEALRACQSPEKALLIRRAFDAAAFSVLRALSIQKQRQLALANTNNFKHKGGGGGSSSLVQNTENRLPVPSLLRTLDELNRAKTDALDIVSHKRKSQSAAASSTSASSKRARGGNGGADSKKHKQDKTTKQKASLTSTSSSKSSSLPTGTSSSDAVPAVQLAGYSNLDSRSTVSRAILCAAASLTFKQLTPNFEGGRGEDINVLNVPQNPDPESISHTESTRTSTSTTELSCKKTDKNDETDPKGQVKDDHVHVHSKNKNDENKQGEGEGGKNDDTKPKINMGAVIMSAEIFAKRSIEQARGAVQRSERRRKWRMDCARAELIVKQNKLGLCVTNPCMTNTDTDMNMNSGGAIARTNRNINPLEEYLTWKNLDVVVTDSEDETTTKHEHEEANKTIVQLDHTCAENRNRMGSSGFVPETQTQSEEWTMRCLPRLLDVMRTGPGHVIYHDLKWNSRPHRIIQLLHGLALDDRFKSFCNDEENDQGYSNYGPHLIITTDHDLDRFMKVLSVSTCTSSSPPLSHLKGLLYNGNASQRRKKRMEHFTSIGLSGFPSSPYNIIVTSYRLFFRDYLHFCQIPFQGVVLDDGMSWLGTAHFDPNGKLGKVFDMAMWSKSDMHSGSAGAGAGAIEKEWDFSLDITSDGIHDAHNRKSADAEGIDVVKGNDRLPSSPMLLGLTARYKILVASKMHSVYRDTIYPAPAPSLLSFLIPQFMDVVREEWDRSRIHACDMSMDHVRKLISRGVVVYTGSDVKSDDASKDLFSLAMAAMMGGKRFESFVGTGSPEDIYLETESSAGKTKTLSLSTDKMISNGQIVQSRRLAVSWLTNGSPIRHELGTVSLDPIMNTIRQARSKNGHVCEEIVPASSILPIAAAGAAVASSVYRTALRCGRTFGSEQGLRQHIAAMHAPPGTWLCRTCAIDCGTSQARTQHERSCTANTAGNTKEHVNGAGMKIIGQITKKQHTVKGDSTIASKDQDGCYRVPGYRGVWVDPKGKHFIKIDGKPFMHHSNDASETGSCSKRMFYESSEEAARMRDNIIRQNGMEHTSEMNYKSDGSRIKYDEATTATAIGRGLEMLGGGASSVVPALSVINIKDLPKGVVPLLRDPRQTSRAGGNSKRYIYAYRGVCRQARKGHDRWQSQISFGGTNHYLGTFDSEWDAAAIYSWAHLILYGDEATKKAQKEGEDAVAAYEQEKKDIAAGKTVAPPPKKKKSTPTKAKGTGQRGRKKKTEGGQFSPITTDLTKIAIPKMSSEFQVSRLPEGDNVLLRSVSERILASRSKVENECVRCISVGMTQNKSFSGCALLVGLSSTDVQWSADDFFEAMYDLIGPEKDIFLPSMKSECSLSVRFRSLIQGTPCFIGKASMTLEQAAVSLGFYGSELGGTIGRVDCNIGGIGWSCSEVSVCISYSSQEKIFHLTVCNENDIVTLNGFQIKASMGNVAICSADVCSVGSRVFLFLLPSAKQLEF